MRQIILSEADLQKICKKIGGELSDRLRNDKEVPVFIGVMKGGLNFMMDLIKDVNIPIMTDYIQISSYDGTTSTGIINMKKELTLDVTGKTIVIVEDVIDTGFSMHYLKSYLKEKYHPKEIIVAVLVDKTKMRKVEVTADYVGMQLDKAMFLMGYGLDYKELSRNVGYVYVPDKEEIEEDDKIIQNQ
jgi:hypoxanthine phosphoribosyltransferase